MTEMPCPGGCNNQARRAWRTYETDWAAWSQTDPEQRGDEPSRPTTPIRYGEPIWCGRCAALIGQALAALDELMALRAMSADGYQAPSRTGDRVASSRGPASPSPAQDDLDELIGWLRNQEQTYRGSQGWPAAPYRGANAPALTTLLSWLGTHLTAVLRITGLAEEFGAGVLSWHSRMQAKTSTRPPLKRKPLPCPRCRRFSLFRHDDESIRCHGQEPDCGRVLTPGEYDALEREADRQVAS